MQLAGRWEQVYWMTDICQGVRLLLAKMAQVCVPTWAYMAARAYPEAWKLRKRRRDSGEL